MNSHNKTSIERTNYFFDGDNKREELLTKSSCTCSSCACPTCDPCGCESVLTTASVYTTKSINRVSQLAVSNTDWTGNDTLANSNALKNE